MEQNDKEILMQLKDEGTRLKLSEDAKMRIRVSAESAERRDRPVRKRGAVLLIAAVIAAVAAILTVTVFALRGAQAPPETATETPEETPEPIELSGIRFYDERKYSSAALSEDYAGEPKMEDVGLRVIDVDGKSCLIYREVAALYDVNGERYTEARTGSGEYLTRWYRNGTQNGAKIYFAGGVVGCLVTGDLLEGKGIFERDMQTGEIKPYIVSDVAIAGMCFYEDKLYFAAPGELIVERRTTPECGSYDDRYTLLCIYCADPATKKITKLCETDIRNASGLFAVDATGVWMQGILRGGVTGALICVDLTGGDAQTFETPDYASCALIDGKIYRYTTFAESESALWVLENGFWKLLFKDDTPYPHTARIVGSTYDEPTFCDGKLVAVRDGRLLLIDLDTKEETVLQTGVVRYEDDRVDFEHDTRNCFTKVANRGTLYFVDLMHAYGEPDNLYIFSSSAPVRVKALDWINETVS